LPETVQNTANASVGGVPLDDPALSASGGSRHIRTLDGIRGLAAIAVFLNHSTVIEGGFWLDTLFARATFLNGCAPMLFLGMAGYLLTGILLRKKGKPHCLRDFYVRHALRIWPLYFAVMAMAMIVLPMFLPTRLLIYDHSGGPGWMYWTFMGNISIAIDGIQKSKILDVTWSLAVEEQFMLFWPLVVLFCSRKTVIRVCIAIAVISTSIRIFMVLAEFNPVAIYVFTFGRLTSIALGSLLAFYAHDERFLKRVRPAARYIGLWVIPLIWAVLAIERHMGWSYEQGSIRSAGPLSRSVGDMIAAVGMLSFILCGLTTNPGSRLFAVLTFKPLTFIGKYSYGLFLFHVGIIWLVRSVIYRPPGLQGEYSSLFHFQGIGSSYLLDQLLFMALTFGISLGLSIASYHLYEVHFLKLKKYFNYGAPYASPAKATQGPDLSARPNMTVAH